MIFFFLGIIWRAFLSLSLVVRKIKQQSICNKTKKKQKRKHGGWNVFLDLFLTKEMKINHGLQWNQLSDLHTSFCLSFCLFIRLFLHHLSTFFLHEIKKRSRVKPRLDEMALLRMLMKWWRGVPHLQHVVMFQAAAVLRFGLFLISVKNVAELAEKAALGDDVADTWAADKNLPVISDLVWHSSFKKTESCMCESRKS